jgi:hypothetical protein
LEGSATTYLRILHHSMRQTHRVEIGAREGRADTSRFERLGELGTPPKWSSFVPREGRR